MVRYLQAEGLKLRMRYIALLALTFFAIMCGVATGWSQTPSSMPTLGCSDDTWAATSTVNVPKPRESHTAIWTGNEMIAWGGHTQDPNDQYYLFMTGGRYNPGTDTWMSTSTLDAPAARTWHTAVWAGGEMIVWGGFMLSSDSRNTGGRYDPASDSWTPTSTANAPGARFLHTAVWSGSEMIVWGGWVENTAESNTGGRYNPVTDSWTATSTVNAPTERFQHTAIWTGSEMIVWGGNIGTTCFRTGGRYTPATDTWTPTSTTNAPAARAGHTAVWTGSEMIVWGGVSFDDPFQELNTGARYNPATDTWTAMSTNDSPDARDLPRAIWSGAEMIVWGGSENSNRGGRYNPATDSWTPTTTANAPTGRTWNTAVWTGTKMIVWGGLPSDITSSRGGRSTTDTGGSYCAQAPNSRSARPSMSGIPAKN